MATYRRQHDRSKKTDKPKFARCEVAGSCQSCEMINSDSSYLEDLNLKFEKNIKQFYARFPQASTQILDVHVSPQQLGYRHHTKLVVQQNEENIQIGLYAPQSHDLVPIPKCPIQSQYLNQIVQLLPDLMKEVDLPGFQGDFTQASLRYLVMRVSHHTDHLLINFVVTQKCSTQLKAICNKLRQLGIKLEAVFYQVNNSEGNTILEGPLEHLYAQMTLRESICGLSFEVGADSFFQVNPHMAEVIYRRIEQLAGRAEVGEHAWDLYSGLGVISLLLARAGYQVDAIEKNARAVDLAKINAKRNSLEGSVQYYSDVAASLNLTLPEESQNPSVICVNPSRAGLGEAVCQIIAEKFTTNKDLKLIYMSCEFQTFMNDVESFEKYGVLLNQLEAFDMFPFTGKLEWLSVLTHNNG